MGGGRSFWVTPGCASGLLPGSVFKSEPHGAKGTNRLLVLGTTRRLELNGLLARQVPPLLYCLSPGALIVICNPNILRYSCYKSQKYESTRWRFAFTLKSLIREFKSKLEIEAYRNINCHVTLNFIQQK